MEINSLQDLSNALKKAAEPGSKILYFKEENGVIKVKFARVQLIGDAWHLNIQGYKRFRGKPEEVAGKVNTLVQKVYVPDQEEERAIHTTLAEIVNSLGKLQTRLNKTGKAPNSLGTALRHLGVDNAGSRASTEPNSPASQSSPREPGSPQHLILPQGPQIGPVAVDHPPVLRPLLYPLADPKYEVINEQHFLVRQMDHTHPANGGQSPAELERRFWTTYFDELMQLGQLNRAKDRIQELMRVVGQVVIQGQVLADRNWDYIVDGTNEILRPSRNLMYFMNRFKVGAVYPQYPLLAASEWSLPIDSPIFDAVRSRRRNAPYDAGSFEHHVLAAAEISNQMLANENRQKINAYNFFANQLGLEDVVQGDPERENIPGIDLELEFVPAAVLQVVLAKLQEEYPEISDKIHLGDIRGKSNEEINRFIFGLYHQVIRQRISRSVQEDDKLQDLAGESVELQLKGRQAESDAVSVRYRTRMDLLMQPLLKQLEAIEGYDQLQSGRAPMNKHLLKFLPLRPGIADPRKGEHGRLNHGPIMIPEDADLQGPNAHFRAQVQ